MPIVTIAQGTFSLKHVNCGLPGVEDRPLCVDNETEDTIIANILNIKCNNLYNSVPHDNFERKHIKDKIQSCI